MEGIAEQIRFIRMAKRELDRQLIKSTNTEEQEELKNIIASLDSTEDILEAIKIIAGSLHVS